MFFFFSKRFFLSLSDLLQRRIEAEWLQPMRVAFIDYFLFISARSFCLPFARSFTPTTINSYSFFFLLWIWENMQDDWFIFVFFCFSIYFAGLTTACALCEFPRNTVSFVLLKKKQKEVCFYFIWRFVLCVSAVQLAPSFVYFVCLLFVLFFCKR